MVSIKRETAKKCRIKDLLDGRYVKREGWNPNYIETIRGRISRANLLGVIISKENNSLVVDDGSGVIELRTFEETNLFTDKNVGEMVTIIGKPRVFNEQKYFVPEIVKKLENKKWVQHRLLELDLMKPTFIQKETLEDTESEETHSSEATGAQKVSAGTNLMDSILKKVLELDFGQGAKVTDVLAFFDGVETNNVLNQLIEQGEIFEIKPGIVKTI